MRSKGFNASVPYARSSFSKVLKTGQGVNIPHSVGRDERMPTWSVLQERIESFIRTDCIGLGGA
jgi:hypothetical protein